MANAGTSREISSELTSGFPTKMAMHCYCDDLYSRLNVLDLNSQDTASTNLCEPGYLMSGGLC